MYRACACGCSDDRLHRATCLCGVKAKSQARMAQPRAFTAPYKRLRKYRQLLKESHADGALAANRGWCNCGSGSRLDYRRKPPFRRGSIILNHTRPNCCNMPLQLSPLGARSGPHKVAPCEDDGSRIIWLIVFGTPQFGAIHDKIFNTLSVSLVKECSNRALGYVTVIVD